MQEIDDFAALLLDEAKRFLERATDCKGTIGESPNLHAALMLAFCALEAHVNAVCDEMAKRTDSPHDRGVLLEKEVRLNEGEFTLVNSLKIIRLEDRLDFLHKNFGQKPAPDDQWRSKLKAALTLRNSLTHPKSVPVIRVADVSRAVEAIIEAIDVLYIVIYKRPFPATSLGLQSTLDF